MWRDLIGLGLAVAALSAASPAAADPAPGLRPAGGALRPAGGALRPPHTLRHAARPPGSGFRHGRFGGVPAGFAGGVVASEAAPPVVAEGPLLTLPQPSELVPSAWGYGTYGIPTVAGIASPPRAEPVVYVIEGGSPRAPATARTASIGPAVYGRTRGGAWEKRAQPARPPASRSGAARVVEVAVPRR
ncbi:hypothetical protein [Methylobacterium sp. ID0610]|uniref:hypothetical protein n=1 Tax=Methylobacterium carpenticola TaxID=3344827 RepID=UPI0036B9C2F0